MKTSIDWISMAKSDDKTRHNLCEVWRYQTYLLATDGHRMHYQDGHDRIAKDYMLNGTEAPSPAFKKVIPDPYTTAECLIKTDKALIQKLRAMDKAIIACCKHAAVTVQIDTMEITISYESRDYSASMRLDLNENSLGTGKACLKFKYLIDALDIHNSTRETVWATIGIRAELDPITVHHALGSAVIMPCKLRTKTNDTNE